jgi:allantoate deiminase
MLVGGSTNALADEILSRCDLLARFSETPDHITRTFLAAPMKQVHEAVGAWMGDAGLCVRLDAIGNLIGHYPAQHAAAPVFLIGSHLDTVPDGGKYDGILGVLLAVAALQRLAPERLPFAVDVLAFSEEEGVRYRASYLGSSAVCGCFDRALLNRIDDAGISMATALRGFGLDPDRIHTAAYAPERVLGYLEAHIEQGPVLEEKNLALGVVEGIVGQSRFWLEFAGKAGHAGTQPMELRHDALVAAAEFVVAVEYFARRTSGLRATVGAISASPGAVNVVPGMARLSLDVRHADDAIREQAIDTLLTEANSIATGRGIAVRIERTDQLGAVATDVRLTNLLLRAAQSVGQAPLRMVSGAGHDAAVMAHLAPVTMLFVRSPGGISHHPDESVLKSDVAAALEVMVAFLHCLAGEMTCL